MFIFLEAKLTLLNLKFSIFWNNHRTEIFFYIVRKLLLSPYILFCRNVYNSPIFVFKTCKKTVFHILGIYSVGRHLLKLALSKILLCSLANLKYLVLKSVICLICLKLSPSFAIYYGGCVLCLFTFWLTFVYPRYFCKV